MPFVKGRKKTGGRKKGTPNVRSQQWDSMGEFLLQQGSERLLDYMQSCEDREYTEIFLRLIEYFKPKQARVEESVEGELTFTFAWQK